MDETATTANCGQQCFLAETKRKNLYNIAFLNVIYVLVGQNYIFFRKPITKNLLFLSKILEIGNNNSRNSLIFEIAFSKC